MGYSTKKVSNELSWSMGVEEMPQQSRFPYPVFYWIFGRKNGITGGKLCAWPFHGVLVFKAHQDQISFTSIQELLEEIDSYGWSEPPYIKEVFKDVIETKRGSPAKNLEEFKQVSMELRQKWIKLIT